MKEDLLMIKNLDDAGEHRHHVLFHIEHDQVELKPRRRTWARHMLPAVYTQASEYAYDWSAMFFWQLRIKKSETRLPSCSVHMRLAYWICV